MPRLLILAGEPSGDEHAGAVARALRELAPDVTLYGIGGPQMAAAGVALLHDLREFSVLGFAEVVGRLPFFFRVLDELKRGFVDDPPDALLLTDFPDFNMKVAEAARRLGIPVVWYISPQVWAWRAGRVRRLRDLVTRMVVVFPFEVEIYRAAGVPVTFVGHPLLDQPPPEQGAPAVRARLGVSARGPLVAFLPGSRRQEIRRILPALAGAALRLRAAGVAVGLSRAAGVDPTLFSSLLADAGGSDLPVWDGAARALAAASDLAVVASGTATLETGLMGTPLVVVYRMGRFNWEIARRLVRLERIGLVNIAAGEAIAPELLQDDVTASRVAEEVEGLLADPERLAAMRRALARLPERLGGPGAAARTARILLEVARGNA